MRAAQGKAGEAAVRGCRSGFQPSFDLRDRIHSGNQLLIGALTSFALDMPNEAIWKTGYSRFAPPLHGWISRK
jgi:hypothetical protein